MPHFICPSCNGALKAPDEKTGESGTCPRCGSWLTVPDQDAVVAVDDDSPDRFAETDEEELPKRQGAAGKSTSTATGTAVGGGGLILLAIAAWVLFRSGLWKRLVVNPIAGWLDAQGVPAAPEVATLLVLAVAVIALAPFVCLWIKARLSAQMPLRVEFLRADPKDFSKLDQQALDRYTKAFEALGFRHAKDYTIRTEIKSPNKGFGRLFIHPKYRCYAEANQVMSGGEGKGAPMRCNLMSLLEEDWSLSSGTRDPISVKTQWLWRRPRSLWTCHPGAAPQAVFKAHMAQRQELIDCLGIEPLADVSPEAYFEHSQDASVERKRAFQRKNILINLIELWLFSKSPRSSWLGEFPKLAKRR